MANTHVKVCSTELIIEETHVYISHDLSLPKDGTRYDKDSEAPVGVKISATLLEEKNRSYIYICSYIYMFIYMFIYIYISETSKNSERFDSAICHLGLSRAIS